MNQMNQLVLEGNAKEFTTKNETKNFTVSRMTVENKRLYKRNDGTLKEEVIPIIVEAYGDIFARQIETAFKGTDEKKCRIIGRLAYKPVNRSKKIVVVAEHIEFCQTA